MPHSLKTLLKNSLSLETAQLDTDITLDDLCLDSRLVKPGDLFICCAGPRAQHAAFIETALKKGAVAVLQESTSDSLSYNIAQVAHKNAPIIGIPSLSEKVSFIAQAFFKNPTAQMKLIGVTGTNGKTSCTQFIGRILTQMHQLCGTIGTLGYGLPDQMMPTQLTTPNPIELQRILHSFQQQSVAYVAMEVSSHSLVQHRVAALSFDTAIFTNLTRDHLDYHGDMHHYGQAKRLLFLSPHLKNAVINAEDTLGQTLLDEFKNTLNCYAYTTQAHVYPNIPTTFVKTLQLHNQGFSARIHSPWGEGILNSTLLGRFNLSNLLATLTTLCACGFSFHDVMVHLAQLKTVPGRMQSVDNTRSLHVVIDYAHTPDALERALCALREHTHKKLWCVFGCGGDRDAGKRPLMAEIAAQYSDYVVVTDDNPRFEDPVRIMDDILKGFESYTTAVHVEHDRKAAIAYAIQHAAQEDIILIAGKGHETVQQVKGQSLPFDDFYVAQSLLG